MPVKCAVKSDMEIVFGTKGGNSCVMKSEGEGAEKLDRVSRAAVQLQRRPQGAGTDPPV